LVNKWPEQGGLKVNPSYKELYLTDAVFEEKFKMTKEAFGQLKEWKQQNKKKDLGLF
jgi:hypothetical protein